jgi:ferredoxin
MQKIDFVQGSELLKLDRLKCLRGDYYHNKCSLCIDICPNNAIDMIREKLTIIDDICTNCAICIGSCPSEALYIKSFDENRYVVELEYNNSNKISCENDSECLAIFDEQHFISMALSNKESIVCDLSHCDRCKLNSEDKIKKHIEYTIEKSNSFLSEISSKKIDTIYTKSEIDSSRRGVLKKVFKTTQRLSEDQSLKQKLSENISISKIPAKRQILKNRLKKIDNLDSKTLKNRYNFLANKTIDYNTCTNCKECIQFCPTEALISSSDQDSILFAIGKCINCNICNDICQESSIATLYLGINLVDFAFDRLKPLVKFDIAICSECKCSFAYKGGVKICSRCNKFKTSTFDDIFKMANEM